jgi:hypothetical protein
MSDENGSFFAEADLLGRYLISIPPNNRVKLLYAKAMSMINIQMDPVDQRLWNMIMHYPFTLRIIDSGLAVVRANSAVRRKIYTMFAILETSPEYCDYFLPQAFGPLYVVNVVFAGARAALAALTGLVVLRLMGVKRQ